MNVEGKLYKSWQAEKLVHFTTANRYIDRNIQKAGVPGVSGCLENTAILTQMIREAKRMKKNLVVTWLDIANAYGSMPHELVDRSLEATHVPEKIREWVKEYYSGVFLRFSTKQFTTAWMQLEKGIVTGCTLSVILFALSMTWLLRTAKEETKGPQMESGEVQSNARLYMDDIQTSTETLVQTAYLLERLGGILNAARLVVKAVKSRILIIYKGEVRKQDVRMNGELITSLTDKPVKYLGKWYNESLKETQQIEEVEKLLRKYLQRIDKSLLPGKFKVWVSQNVLMPILMWPLSIYEVTMTQVEKCEKLITKNIKAWLGIPKSLSTAALYGRSTKLQLPVKSLSEEVKVVKARNKVTLEDSKDEKIRGAGIEVNIGRKWKADTEVEDARSALRMQEIAGIGCRGREGIGLTPRRYYSKVGKKERRKMVVGKVREKEEQKRQVKLTGLAKQGRSSTWEVEERRLTEKQLWEMEGTRLKFLVKSVYDLLPTPQNKNVWYKTEENVCTICGDMGTLKHILSSCKVSLSQGRYTFRHNKVLRVLAEVIEKARVRSNNTKEMKKTAIMFIKAGQKGTVTRRSTRSYFDGSQDWKMVVDLDRQLKVPEHIVITSRKPDIVVYSNRKKQVLMIELTVPYEDRIGEANELKRSKYEELRQDCIMKGWNCQVWPVEVGARGFVGRSVGALLKELGVTGAERKKSIQELSAAAEEGSRILWSSHQQKEWYTKV